MNDALFGFFWIALYCFRMIRVSVQVSMLSELGLLSNNSAMLELMIKLVWCSVDYVGSKFQWLAPFFFFLFLENSNGVFARWISLVNLHCNVISDY